MTREQYKSLQLVQLKELAKSRGLKHISTLKKDELIDRMLEEDARESEEKETAEPEEAQAAENEKQEEEMKPASAPSGQQKLQPGTGEHAYLFLWEKSGKCP